MSGSLPEIMRSYFETIYHESQKQYTRLILKALGVFSLLITSKIESFSTKNFVTFPNIKCRIRTKQKCFEICILGLVT